MRQRGLSCALILACSFVPTVAATRFYLPVSTAADVSPSFSSGWEETDGAIRRALVPTKGTSAITTGTQLGWTPGSDQLDRQYIGPPMNAGIVINGMSVKMQLMAREFNNADNSTSRVALRIMDRAGVTTRCAIFAVGQAGPATEYINNAGMRNKTFISSTVVAGSCTTLQGDRIVLEIGHGDSGVTPEAQCKFGENATDCAENETSTTNCAGWIEFSGTITFESYKPKAAGPLDVF